MLSSTPAVTYRLTRPTAASTRVIRSATIRSCSSALASFVGAPHPLPYPGTVRRAVAGCGRDRDDQAAPGAAAWMPGVVRPGGR